MKFVDSCRVDLIAGTGGNGSVAFRREKFVPFGGPSGGDGGRGADIIFVADSGLSTLLDLTYGRTLRGEFGEHGQGADCYGKAAKPFLVRVPVGTQVFDRETDQLLFDIDTPGAKIVVARGGKGGRGNIHFATPYDRAPRRSEPGEPGQELKLRLELKVMADVGLLGFPNVGKSTFIRAVSRATPKVADYPFTTLTPSLGVVRVGDEATFVLADIPGLIPGAADGAGLGHRFLKHVERCRALLHLVTLDPTEDREPLADYDALRLELQKFDPELSKRPQIVALSKADITEVREAYPALKAAFKKKKVDLRLVSAATGEGMKDLSRDLYKLVTGKPIEDWEVVPEARHNGAMTNEPKTKSIANRIGAAAADLVHDITEAVSSVTSPKKKAAPKPASKKTTAAPKKTAKAVVKKVVAKAKKAAGAVKKAAKKATAKKSPAAKKKATGKKKTAPTKKRATAKKK